MTYRIVAPVLLLAGLGITPAGAQRDSTTEEPRMLRRGPVEVLVRHRAALELSDSQVAALREEEGDPPANRVDWEGLRAAIHARAELPLAAPRPAVPPVATAEEALQPGLSEQEFQLLVSGRTDADRLLLIAAGDG